MYQCKVDVDMLNAIKSVLAVGSLKCVSEVGRLHVGQRLNVPTQRTAKGS